ncbi:MAG: c-type cytochrome domain-containing protein, partial [Vicinamibacterales bacterium]
LVSGVACGGGSSPTSASSAASTPITVMGNGITTYTYTNDVRPLLAADCFSCHGPSVQQNGFNFSTYAGVLQALTPGSDASLIVRVTQAGGLMYAMLTGDRNQTAGINYDGVVNSNAAQ